MIKLTFTIQRDVFSVEVIDRTIFYSDRKLKNKIRLIPVDETLSRQIALSRNRIPAYILDMFTLTEEEKKEYDSATNEEELAKICIKDCNKQGAVLQKKEVR